MHRGIIYVTAVMTCGIALGQAESDSQLARRLADPATRSDAVSRVLREGADRIPLLLSWAKRPPEQVNEYELDIGLADVFGQLKAREAIPFLIKNINLSLTNKANTWLKTAEIVEREMPAVAALVRIGLPASRAIMRAFETEAPMSPVERLPLIFVVSRIKDPEARGFLSSVCGQANLERYWAEDGLKNIPEKP